MMRVFVFFFCMLVAGFSQAQTTPLTVQGVSPKLYVEHKVAPKENWYSVGRLYNISPKELAPFNSLSMDKPLSIGQELKVPLTATNFSQDGAKAADEVFVPVYHTVQEKEWMYRLSTNYNKVAFANLEKWNGLPHGAVLKPGMQMVVGYLKVKTGQSALASKGTSKIPVVTAPPVVATTTEPVTTKKPEEKKPEEKKPEPVTAKTEPATTKPEPVVKNDPPPAPKTETPKEQPPVQTAKPVTATTPPANAPDNKGGYFKSGFTEAYKSSSGSAGVFKSTSGWNDGKYYALMNNVGVGSIVKVSTPTNGKTVYAKVLGSLPDMKESAGLTIRISDAAAAELGANAQKFGVDIKY